ncbi:TIGR04255 family protein [Vibrio parahaemolyticus]|uniref:TIGR04255 family protein n=1 Tax=Vibrio parahaemolyticus TaxID=670 RepID=UPI00215D0E41|nr:TIGR04255 family protein [Vibrio parahaemolyticus]MCR9645929.1 TIGR04255 family protein [Vibrio parahaemolyticus]MCR9799790.1 TIGR04255 family protein [Vibrio parahaemolyticus]MDF4316108.1 TIGR04255 family protein [Vibrio parahaemolyticus]MDT8848294.1 TIGR04255 family protein [Vibrio parahaemolyticus]MDT8920658.1 TIGR04255 family protein [Vibrio parahaemolyticus]
MVNKIVAKKASIRFEPLGVTTLKSKLEALQEALRDRFPKSKMPRMQAFNIDLTNPNSIQVDQDGAHELHMVSADNVHALKIGNQGFDYSIRGYVSYEHQREMFLHVVDLAMRTMDVKYVGHLSVHNINMFAFDAEGAAANIRENSPFAAKDKGIDDSWQHVGAATRHDYELDDGLVGLVIHSTIAQEGQSFIPQPEWELWQLMGGIPVVQERSLLLTIAVAHNQEGKAQRTPQGVSLVNLDLEDVANKFDLVHEHLNRTYDSITKES